MEGTTYPAFLRLQLVWEPLSSLGALELMVLFFLEMTHFLALAWPVGVQAVRAERQLRRLLPATPGALPARSDSGRVWLFSVHADAVCIPLCPLFKKGHGVARVASPLPSGRRDAWCGTECVGHVPGLLYG